MKLCLPEKRTLLALRAGSMDTSTLTERLGKAHMVSHLIRKGLVVNRDGVYSLTAKGRELCPSRRELEAKDA